MTDEKKAYEPGDVPSEPKPEMISKKDIVYAIVRRADGELVIMDGSLTNCQNIKEAWLIRAMVDDSVEQFVNYLRMAMMEEKKRLQPGFMNGLRNGLRKK
jgi:hypothetical protein